MFPMWLSWSPGTAKKILISTKFIQDIMPLLSWYKFSCHKCNRKLKVNGSHGQATTFYVKLTNIWNTFHKITEYRETILPIIINATCEDVLLSVLLKYSKQECTSIV
jgi:hypothetical protein